VGRTDRQNCGNQSNRASKVLRKGKHVGEIENYEWIELSILCGGSVQCGEQLACETPNWGEA